jgi:hypothetical protein
MKHITVADKSLIVGDDAADLLISYATLLAESGHADNIELRAISGDGDEVLVTFLLNAGITIVAETIHTSQPEPDNNPAVTYLQSAIAKLTAKQSPSAEDISGASTWNGPEEDEPAPEQAR